MTKKFIIQNPETPENPHEPAILSDRAHNEKNITQVSVSGEEFTEVSPLYGTVALPLSDELPPRKSPKGNIVRKVDDGGPSIEALNDLVADIEKEQAKIRAIQNSPEWNDHERADKIQYCLNKIAKYRKTLDEWINLRIANGWKSPAFNKLVKRYHKTK